AELADVAVIPGVPRARLWGDAVPAGFERWFDVSEAELRRTHAGVFGRPHHYLSISGGGADGAFGAGLLCGWTEAGTRPEFTLVSGISTGALIAPFAFLGPAYDDKLRELYTSYSTKDLATKKSMWSVLRGPSFMDTGPMAEKAALYYDAAVLDAIAEESRKGRALYIGTTNLDAHRPVIWDIGAIARSDAPNRVQLFQDVLLASAAIPAAFDPVYFEVEANGQRYQELHVDGGATSQLFLYPIGVDWGRVLAALEVPGKPTVYTIRNAKLAPSYRTVEPRLLAISTHTMSALMDWAGQGDLYRTYLSAVRDGLGYRLAYIPESFTHAEAEPFDLEYMRALFELGRSAASAGYPWDTAPPGVLTDGTPP
ncbi:MAG TPA: patatin-like phospholipase family protein, partial [Planctomycetota bacterium]|nr:patatin-like phospholipase family protein [Planctomycetota bacterium]